MGGGVEGGDAYPFADDLSWRLVAAGECRKALDSKRHRAITEVAELRSLSDFQ